MKKTLVLFAHPYFEHSTTNIKLLKCYENIPNLTFCDLYEEYPDFHIHTFRERKKIVDFERIIFHFPIIWFGLPPLLQLWIHEVFDMRWISDSKINILSGKDAVIITSVGGSKSNYTKDGKYKTTVENLLEGLNVSLNINHILLKKTHVIYNADDLNDYQLDIESDELSEIMKMK